MQIALKTRGKDYGVQHLLAAKSGPCLDVLAESLSIPSEKIEFLLKMGCLYWKDQRVHDQHLPIEKGDYLRVHLQPRRFSTADFDIKASVIHQCEDYLVINKPAGIPVHPTVDNLIENLKSLLETSLKIEIFVTHRLDVPTSGLMVYAKSKDFQRHFNKALTEGQVRKIYRARVHGHYDGPTELVHHMENSPRAPKRVFSEPRLQTQVCRLQILDLQHLHDDQTELVMELLTGRTHQIRAQLSFEGHPIVGDLMYGSHTDLQTSMGEKIALRASYLAFPDMSGTQVQFRN